jgi:hypothetical protein
MPLEGYRAIAIEDVTFELLTEVVIEYSCDSVAEAVKKSATVPFQQYEAELAQILAGLLDD